MTSTAYRRKPSCSKGFIRVQTLIGCALARLPGGVWVKIVAEGFCIRRTMSHVASRARMSIGLGRVTMTAAVDTSNAALMAGAECGGVSITTRAAPRFFRVCMRNNMAFCAGIGTQGTLQPSLTISGQCLTPAS